MIDVSLSELWELVMDREAWHAVVHGEIERTKDRGGSGRADLLFTIAVDLSILCFFKYFSFLMDNINALTGMNISYTALALPIGISFYTFQAMSYIFDVR